jgi:hypothetical protein
MGLGLQSLAVFPRLVLVPQSFWSETDRVASCGHVTARTLSLPVADGGNRYSYLNAYDYSLIDEQMSTDLRPIAQILRHASRVLVALAVVAVVIALLYPTSHSLYVNSAFIGLVLAFLCAFWRIYILKLPIHGRGGALITIAENPIPYRMAFIGGSVLGVFLLYVLIHACFTGHPN